MWTIDGAYYYSSTVSLSFSLAPGQSSRTLTVKLKVRDDENTWTTSEGRMTKTYTIRRGQNRHFYLKDHLGSVRVTVDEEGEPLGYDDYYPYGLQMPTRSSNTSNPNDRYKFTGHERDTEAGLTFDYMGARTYDPLLGIFMQIDPLMEFSTPYSYVGANPVNLTDPTGMSSECANRGHRGIEDLEAYLVECGSQTALTHKTDPRKEIEREETEDEEQEQNKQLKSVPFEKINIHDASDQEVIDQVFKYLFYLLQNNQTQGNLNQAFTFTKKGFFENYESGPIGGGFVGSRFDGTININGKNHSISMFLGFSDNKIEDSFNTGVNFENNVRKQSETGTTQDAVHGTTTTNFQLFIGAPYSRNEYKPVMIVTQDELVRNQLYYAFKTRN